MISAYTTIPKITSKKNMLDAWEKNNPGVKYSIIRFQETMKGNLREVPETKVNLCELCGEPASGEICKTCTLFKQLGLNLSGGDNGKKGRSKG